MGDVLSLKLKPVIRVELCGAIWVVSIRPCPADLPSMKSCKSECAAAHYANELREQHGWKIRPEHYDYSLLTTQPGAA